MKFAEGLIVADRFRLVRPLGQGGMGAVWLAQHTQLDVPCAVKFINEEAARSPELRARFEREAKAAAQLRTPHVVQILDHGVWQDVPYIAMECLEGEDLGQRLARVGTLSPADTVAVAVQIARALTRAHAAGLVHRDLKPGNVFLVRDDEREIAKVLDFGVAKVKEMGLDGSTKTGAILGTPYYMSPEQARGNRDVDHRSDLWALAVVVYQCLTGHLPFGGQALGDLFVKIIADPLPIPSHVAHVPPGFDAWWVRAAARDPGQRFQTAKELGEALSLALGVTVLTGVEVGSIMASPKGSPSHPPPGLQLTPSQGGVGTPMPRVAMGGTPMPNVPTPAPQTPFPGGMTPAGVLGAAPSGAWPGAGGGSVSGSFSGSAGSVAAPPRRGGLVAALIVGALVLCGGGAFFALRGGSHDSIKGPASSAAPTVVADAPTTTATASASPPASAAVVEPASPAPSAATAAVSAAASAAPALPSQAGSKKVGGPLPAAAGKARPSCDPNYYLDADGQKHFKPECFK